MDEQEALDHRKEELDSVYTERNLCVALIAQYAPWFGHKIGLKRHVGAKFDDEWQTVLFIDLPTGQVSWHLHERELVNFPDVGVYDGEWDGHTTEEKYERVKKFIHLGKPTDFSPEEQLMLDIVDNLAAWTLTCWEVMNKHFSTSAQEEQPL
jgi:hypothetical protein